MGLETGTYVSDLVGTNPISSDQRSQGDDHLRLVKAVLASTLPNANKEFYFPTTVADKTIAYSILPADEGRLIPADATAGAFTITLPAAPNDGFTVFIKKVDSSVNAVTVDGNGADTIDAVANFILALQNEVVGVTWDNTDLEWHVKFSYSPRSRSWNTSAQAVNFNVTAADKFTAFIVDASGGAITASPSAVATLGDEFIFFVLNEDTTNNVIIDPNGAETINKAATFTVGPLSSVAIICDGTELFVLSNFFVEDVDTLKADVADVLTAGFAATPFDNGTQSGAGTLTPDEANGNLQFAVNGGAHTLAPPVNNCSIVIQYTNNAIAGAITTTGFTTVTGDAISITDGDDFLFNILNVNGFSLLHVVALQ